MVCSKCGSTDHNARKCTGGAGEAPQQQSPLSLEQIRIFTTLSDIAIQVGKALHKGRQECVYQKGIAIELSQKNIKYTSEEVIPVTYNGVSVGFERMDLYCYELGVVLELKAVTGDIRQEFIWQLVNYMREKSVALGMVVNYSQGVGKGVQMEYVICHEGAYFLWKKEGDTMSPLGDGGY